MYVIIKVASFFILASKIDPIVVIISTGTVMYCDYRNYNNNLFDLPIHIKYFLPYVHLYDNDALIHIKRALTQLALS